LRMRMSWLPLWVYIKIHACILYVRTCNRMRRIHSQSGVTAIDTTVASLLCLRHLTQLLPSLGIEQVLLKSVNACEFHCKTQSSTLSRNGRQTTCYGCGNTITRWKSVTVHNI
jgi:hypothetical protein